MTPNFDLRVTVPLRILTLVLVDRPSLPNNHLKASTDSVFPFTYENFLARCSNSFYLLTHRSLKWFMFFRGVLISFAPFSPYLPLIFSSLGPSQSPTHQLIFLLNLQPEQFHPQITNSFLPINTSLHFISLQRNAFPYNPPIHLFRNAIHIDVKQIWDHYTSISQTSQYVYT